MEQANKPAVIAAYCVSTARLGIGVQLSFQSSSCAVENGDNPSSWKLEFEKTLCELNSGILAGSKEL